MATIYKGILSERGRMIRVCDALKFMLARCGLAIENENAIDHNEAMAALIQWFYSGDFVEVDDEQIP